jgi:hypothetical protein
MVGYPVIPGVVWLPVGVVSVVVVPVVGSPWVPPHRADVPVPCRTPDYISGMVNVPYNRPGMDLNMNRSVGCDRSFYSANIGRVWSFLRISGIIGFNDVVFAIQCFVADQLYSY